MANNDNFVHIDTYKKKWHFNIGLVLFGAILIYLIVAVLMYLTADKITMYEVREGTILRDYAYNGIVLRSEEVVNSEGEGYRSYYVPEESKVAANSPVYAVLADKSQLASDTETAPTVLTNKEEEAIFLKIQKFNEVFQEQQFSRTYTLKDDLKNAGKTAENKHQAGKLDTLLAEGEASGVQLFQAPNDGIAIYSIDGFESVTSNTVSKDILAKSGYEKIDLQDKEQISKGEAAYKLITEEAWSIVIELSEETSKELAEKDLIKVRIPKDNEILWANLSIEKREETHFATLNFKQSMVRYASDRFLDIELIFEDKTGLKIPKSTKVEKTFFVIPNEYITKGGNSKENGVLRQTKNKKGALITEFLRTEVYFEEDGFSYLDPNVIKKSDILLLPESNETFAIKEERKLTGVYNINKGYAVFKQIKILCESDEYYIVEEGNSYGLYNYDHIVLDGKTVKENDLVFQ